MILRDKGTNLILVHIQNGAAWCQTGRGHTFEHYFSNQESFEAYGLRATEELI